jgi:hypothetical protein
MENVEVHHLGKLDSNTVDNSLKASADHNRFAYISSKRHPSMKISDKVIVDGRIHGEFEHVPPKSLCFSPDSRKVAYAAIREGVAQHLRPVVVIDDQILWGYGTLVSNIIFSLDSTHFVFVGDEEQRGQIVVLDGKAVGRYEGVGLNSLSFSPDSKRAAFVDISKGNSHVKIIDLNSSEITSGPRFEEGIGSGLPIFSPDARHFAYVAGINGRQGVLLDNDLLGTYDGVLNRSLTFMRDSLHIEYVAHIKDHHALYRDHNTILELPANYQDFGLAPNRARVAMVIKEGDQSTLVIDGQRILTARNFGSLTFSPDSQHFAYAVERVITPNNRLVWTVLVDDQVGPDFASIKMPGIIFAPDSLDSAYIGNRWGTMVLVFNQKERYEFRDIVTDSAPSFDDNGNFLFVGVLQNEEIVKVSCE